jgi:hypothetical protein
VLANGGSAENSEQENLSRISAERRGGGVICHLGKTFRLDPAAHFRSRSCVFRGVSRESTIEKVGKLLFESRRGEMADAWDLKSLGAQALCGFESRRRHSY